MKKKRLILLTLIIFAIISVSFAHSYKQRKHITQLEKVSSEAIDLSLFNNYFSNKIVKISNSTIHFTVDIEKDFLDLENRIQAFKLAYLTKKIRMNLKGYHNELWYTPIKITGHYGKDTYEFKSRLHDNSSLKYATVTMKLNGKEVYSSISSKKDKAHSSSTIEQEEINGFKDIDIYNFTVYFFNFITKNGKYFNPDVDNKLLLDTVTDRFQISKEEMITINKKYELLEIEQ